MKRKITLTIDSDVYDQLVELPRKVSVSETVNWILKLMLEDVKAGKELTSDEMRRYLKETPEGKDFLERADEHLGPKVRKLEEEIDRIKKSLGLDKKKVKK